MDNKVFRGLKRLETSLIHNNISETKGLSSVFLPFIYKILFVVLLISRI